MSKRRRIAENYEKEIDFNTDYKSRRLSKQNPSTQSVPQPQAGFGYQTAGGGSHSHTHSMGGAGAGPGPAGAVGPPGATAASVPFQVPVNPDTSLVEELWDSILPLVNMAVEQRCAEIIGTLQDQINELWAYLREEEEDEE